MHWCPGCAACCEDAGCYCEPCHAAILADLHRRRSLPAGGLSCPEPAAMAPAPEIERPLRGGPVMGPPDPSIREARAIIREVAKQVPCKGGTFHARDGPPSWMEDAVRAWEDNDSV